MRAQYLIQPLRALACEKFSKRCETEWASPEFAKAVDELYKHCSDMDELKGNAVFTIKKHAKDVFDGRASGFEDLVEVLRLTEFGADVACVLAGGSDSGNKTYNCPSCQKVFTVAAPPGCKFSCSQGCHTGFNGSWWASYILED